MAILSKAIHYSIDAVLLSTLLAGVKRTTGYTPNPSQLPFTTDPTFSSLLTRYLSIGENVFDYTSAWAHTSKYFQQTNATIGMTDTLEEVAKKVGEEARRRYLHQGAVGAGEGGTTSGRSWWGGGGASR